MSGFVITDVLHLQIPYHGTTYDQNFPGARSVSLVNSTDINIITVLLLLLVLACFKYLLTTYFVHYIVCIMNVLVKK